jgi:alanine-alpha-ketoisovalerate/valine-pyruvate aminotransferase
MNYIKKLEAQVKSLSIRIEATEQAVRDLRDYALSPKFMGPEISDQMINKKDVITRCDEILNPFFTGS